LYVDDFLICYSSKSIIDIERQLQLSINKLDKWTMENGFRISKNKTVAMHFCHKYKTHSDPTLKLGDQEISFVKQTKFLGLTWDHKLTFIPHIKYLKQKCTKALNIIKVLAHTDWGADQSTLLQLYRALIRSKLDYGCIVYGSARASYIKQLDTIQNQALRLCLGAFRSSPADSLCVEANEPPLDYRRKKLALQYGVKLKANPSNPAYHLVFKPAYKEQFIAKPREIPPFSLRLETLLELSNIDLNDIAINNIPKHPVWDQPPPKCLFHLASHTKSDTPPHIYRAEYMLIKEKYLEFCPIYTDGSKHEEKVSAAYSTAAGTRSIRLPDGTSIFTAEASAIIQALRYIAVSHRENFIIFSDSLSILQSIDNQTSSNPLIGNILQSLVHIHEQNKELLFCWVPGHCGISGNEHADRAAKDALNKTVTPIQIPASDKICHIRRFISKSWQTHWDQQIQNKLHNIKPKLGPPGPPLRSRKDQVVLNRIRIGHTRLSHSFLMERIPPPVCPNTSSSVSFLQLQYHPFICETCFIALSPFRSDPSTLLQCDKSETTI
jgi:ribonuclease HI